MTHYFLYIRILSDIYIFIHIYITYMYTYTCVRVQTLALSPMYLGRKAPCFELWLEAGGLGPLTLICWAGTVRDRWLLQVVWKSCGLGG